MSAQLPTGTFDGKFVVQTQQISNHIYYGNGSVTYYGSMPKAAWHLQHDKTVLKMRNADNPSVPS